MIIQLFIQGGKGLGERGWNERRFFQDSQIWWGASHLACKRPSLEPLLQIRLTQDRRQGIKTWTSSLSSELLTVLKKRDSFTIKIHFRSSRGFCLNTFLQLYYYYYYYLLVTQKKKKTLTIFTTTLIYHCNWQSNVWLGCPVRSRMKGLT